MSRGISGRTRVCGIFGFPVDHSFSPAMHNAAFCAAGLNYVYVPFQVQHGDLAVAVNAVRTLGLAGVNVTAPHKEVALPLLDELSAEAELIGAVNTIVNQSGRLYGDNTDGRGFLRSLQENASFDPAGRTILILGAGGAARAVAVQLALAGAGKLFFTSRSGKRAVNLADFIRKKIGTPVEVVPWPERGGVLPGKILLEADLVVHATPLGMGQRGTETVPLPFELFKPGQLACDLVYSPSRTVFLERAGLAGATAVGGLGMLLHQGALSFELWTGVTAPLEVMRKALEEVILCSDT